MANEGEVKPNRMVLRDVDDPNKEFIINLADDDLEVRGFGQAIPREKARKMANRYFESCEAGWEVIKKIESNVMYKDLSDMEEFKQLKEIIDPAAQTVSGVFGKEIILRILEMRHCEGIRYVIGNDGHRNTVILIGVDEHTELGEKDGRRVALSVPVDLKGPGRTVLTAQDQPVDGEVHKHSMNIAEARNVLDMKAEFNDDPAELLFGPWLY